MATNCIAGFLHALLAVDRSAVAKKLDRLAVANKFVRFAVASKLGRFAVANNFGPESQMPLHVGA